MQLSSEIIDGVADFNHAMEWIFADTDAYVIPEIEIDHFDISGKVCWRDVVYPICFNRDLKQIDVFVENQEQADPIVEQFHRVHLLPSDGFGYLTTILTTGSTLRDFEWLLRYSNEIMFSVDEAILTDPKYEGQYAGLVFIGNKPADYCQYMKTVDRSVFDPSHEEYDELFKEVRDILWVRVIDGS